MLGVGRFHSLTFGDIPSTSAPFQRIEFAAPSSIPAMTMTCQGGAHTKQDLFLQQLYRKISSPTRKLYLVVDQLTLS
jgi:hypothetical protein